MAKVEAATHPFPGLRPFREEEEYLFFGRERQVDQMVDRLAAHRLLAVLGPSGSGKSSLVNCGLRPALHRGLLTGAGTAWRIAQFRPGVSPVSALARALARPGVLFEDFVSEELSLEQIVEATLRMSKLGLVDIFGQARPERDVSLLVVADQLEELFRFRETAARGKGEPGGGEEAVAFVNLLLEAGAQQEWPVYVVLTMRSDFLGDCAQFQGLPEAVNRGQYLVPRMTRDERRAAIAGPVAVGGAQIDAALLTRLVNDVGDNPDQLSILQHALHRTWEVWRLRGGEGPLRLEHYEAIGTMTAALDRHAEQTFAGLDDGQRRLCERIFKALTEKGRDLRGTRRPTRLAALAAQAEAAPSEVAEVIEVFRHPSCSFLMPPVPEPLVGDTVVDISHESLMRIWSRLRAWVGEEAESARFYARVAETAELHRAGRAGLWGDPDLPIAAAWRRDHRPNAAWAAQYPGDFGLAVAFLDQSQAAWDAEQARVRARRQAETSQRLALEAQRALPADHELALLLAVAAGRAGATDEAERALRLVVEHRGRSLRRLVHPDSVLGVAWSADGGRLLTACRDGMARIWEAAAGTLVAELVHDALVAHAAWSPDGLRVATASHDKTARVWDAATGAERARLVGHDAVVAQVAWSPDGRLLATASYDRTARIWDAATGAPARVLVDPAVHGGAASSFSHQSWVRALAWSPDARWVATASEDRTAKLWDAATGRLLATLRGHKDRLRALAWSPDGRRLATAGADGVARVWDAATGEAVHELRGHRDWVVDVRWSGDGGRLATASRDGAARVWDAASGEQRGEPLARHGDGVLRIAWSATGARLAAAGADGTATLWDEASVERPTLLTGHRGPVVDLAWQPGGGLVATAAEDGTARVWDPRAGTLLRLGVAADGAAAAVWDARWSPDGARVVTGDHGGGVVLWDAATGAPLDAFRGHRGPVLRTAWAAGGTAVASVSRDHRAALWRPLADAAPVLLEGHRGGVLAAAVHPGGALLATGGLDHRLCLWDLAAPGPPTAVVEAHAGWIAEVAWSGDGSRLLTAGYDGLVRVWEVTDPAAPQAAATLAGHTSAVLHAAWDPGGGRVAAVGLDGTARIWDAATGALLRSLHGHIGWTLRVAWRPDGRQLATAGRDGTVRLWDPDDPRPKRALAGHRGPVRWVGYAADGARLLTAGDDGTARLWHVATAGAADPEIAVVARHRGRILTAAWSPDGARILTAGADGTVRVCLARLEALVAEAARRAVRGATREEASRYGLDAGAATDVPPAPAPCPVPAVARLVAAGRPTVAGIVFAKNEWARELRRGMEAGAAEAGVEVDIEHHQFDLAEEVRLLQRALDRGVAAIVLAVRDLEASVPMIRAARERGVVVICAGTCINHRDAAQLVTAFYESDQVELGYRTGLVLAQWVFDHGLADRPLRAGIVHCEQFEQCYQRGRGIRTALAEAGVAWREVDSREGLLEPNAVAEARQMLLAHPEIDVVWTQHDESTRGAVAAIRQLRSEGRAGKVVVFGVDWSPAAGEMLAAPDGILQATTGQQAREMGRLAVLDAARALRGEEVGHYHKVLASPLHVRGGGGGRR